MKRVCIHQPDFAPYLGFFDRLLDSDLFVILDDAQFQKGGWNHRDQIKTPRGPAWLTLSVTKGPLHRPILDVELAANREVWVAKNLNQLRENYEQAPFFERVFPEIAAIYQQPWTYMVDINMAFLRYLLDRLEIDVEIVHSSTLGIPGASNQRLVDILRAVGGDHYISGTGALAYLDHELFGSAGIVLEIQQFHHPIYPQLFGDFIPFLSTFDLLLNCGPNARDIVRSCRAPK